LFCNPKRVFLLISASYYKIITSSEGYEDVLSKLREEGIPFEQDNGHELLPLNPIEVIAKCYISGLYNFPFCFNLFQRRKILEQLAIY
jgi:hypothetical protein